MMLANLRHPGLIQSSNNLHTTNIQRNLSNILHNSTPLHKTTKCFLHSYTLHPTRPIFHRRQSLPLLSHRTVTTHTLSRSSPVLHSFRSHPHNAPQRRMADNPFAQNDPTKQHYPKTKTRPRQAYHESLEDPNKELPKTRFIKHYGVERTLWGHDVHKASGEKSFLEGWEVPVNRSMRPPSMARIMQDIKQWKNKKKLDNKRKYLASTRRHWHRTMDIIIAAGLIEIFTGSDLGWEGFAFLGSIAMVILLGIPFLIILTVMGFGRYFWRKYQTRENEKLLHEKYAELDGGRVTGEIDHNASPEQQSADDVAYFTDKVEDTPTLDTIKYKKYVLEKQKEEIHRIRDGGPKSMLDFMLERLRIEQDELRLDRDIVMMEIERIEKMIRKNIRRYKTCMRRLRSGDVLRRYEETIEAQKDDLRAYSEELKAIDERGWELKTRVDVLEQQLHNAIYSNINGIDHPVVRDILSNDLIEVLFGHIPSDLLDQSAIQEFSNLLAPLQQAIRSGKVTVEEMRDKLEHEFGIFYPEAFQYSSTLPLLSQISNSNVDKRFPKGVQFVMEPLVDPGISTQKFIQVAVDDFTTEFQDKYQWLDSFTNVTKTDDGLYLDEDGKVLSEIDRRRLEDKVRLKALQIQQRKKVLTEERTARHLRYVQSKHDYDSHQRKLGILGKDNLDSITQDAKYVMDVPIPESMRKNVKKDVELFVNDGSLVGRYDEELQLERERLEKDFAIERERQAKIDALNVKKQGLLNASSQDPRLIHQLETERIAFGDKIVLKEEIDQNEVDRMYKFMSNFGVKYDEESRKQTTADIKAQPKFWAGTMFQQQEYELDLHHHSLPFAVMNFFKGDPDTMVRYMKQVRKDNQMIDSVMGSIAGGDHTFNQNKEKPQDNDINDKWENVFSDIDASVNVGDYDRNTAAEDVAYTYNPSKMAQEAENQRKLNEKEGILSNLFSSSKKQKQTQEEARIEALRIEKLNTQQAAWNLKFDDFEKIDKELKDIDSLKTIDSLQKRRSAEKHGLMRFNEHINQMNLPPEPEPNILEVPLKKFVKKKVFNIFDIEDDDEEEDQSHRENKQEKSGQNSTRMTDDEFAEMIKKNRISKGW